MTASNFLVRLMSRTSTRRRSLAPAECRPAVVLLEDFAEPRNAEHFRQSLRCRTIVTVEARVILQRVAGIDVDEDGLVCNCIRQSRSPGRGYVRE